MRFFLFLLLSIHLCSTAYGQNFCDQYSNLPEAFDEGLDEFIALFDEQSLQDKVAHSDFMASLLWECSNDTQEFNNLMLHTLNIYFTQPHMRAYIFKFLDALSSNYEEIEASNEEHNEWNRSVKNTAWAYVGLRALRWVISQTIDFFPGRFRWLKGLSALSMRRELAFSALAGTSTAVVSEMTEEDLSVKLDPSILSTSLIAFEMYNLQSFACELTEDLKTTNITSQERFDETTAKHENLMDSYALTTAERPGFSFTQDIILPHAELEAEIYTEFNKVIQDTWIPANPNRACRNNNHTISLDIAACYLEESARLLNDSPFSTQPIRFGSEFIRCSQSVTLNQLP